MQREAAETTHFDAFAVSQSMTHLLDDALHGHLDIGKRKVGLAPGERLDQFGFSHGPQCP
jgi:hypothetical protein